jgi:cyanophycinase
MLRTLCFALALAGALAAGASAAAAPGEILPGGAPKGSLVIIGGGLQPDNAEVWQKIVALAGGKGARIAVLPTAAGNPEREGQLTVTNLNHHGAQAFVVPLAPRLAGRDARKDADDPALARALRDAGGVFFTGGDQGRITAVLRHADGSNTAVLDALWALYRRGGVIAGTSAGAAIMSSTMFYDPPAEVLPVLKNGVVDGKDVAPGLGFIGDDVFVDQHLLVRGRFARMLPAMLAKHYVLGLGIDENTAAVIGPGRDVTMIGYRGAIVLELAQASSDKTQPGFNIANARISYLDSGDRFNLTTRTFYPGPGKERIHEAVPEHRPPIFYTDILGNTAVVNLLEKLVDSDQQRAVGVAFEGPGSPMAERGFEFTFTRMPDSGEFATNREDAFSIYRIRMDVRPVRVRQPFYE